MSTPTVPLEAPPLPTTPVWLGSTGIEENADSPEVNNTKDGIVYIKTYRGPIATLLSAMPSRLSTVSGVPTLFRVDSIKVKNGPGGVGTMTLICCCAPTNGPEDGTPTEEVEWTEVQRPLKSHPMFQVDGDYELELTDLAAIQIWQQGADPVMMAAFQYYNAAGAVQTLTTNAQIYATKWLRGQEFYNEYAPVCRSTVSSVSAPTSGGCGIIASSPGIASPPPYYKWLKNADRVVKRGRTWERIQEWIGAWWWDTDIYAEANTGGSDGGGSGGGFEG